jgi:putative ABC transport system permease protein
MIEGIFVEGLIYGIMALGVFLTFRVLNFPDLTVDGSFPMGAVIMAMALTSGLPVTVGLLLAFAGGVLAGCVTATIHNKLRVPHLLAGILTMTMLYSVNIRILHNRANLPLLRVDTIMTHVSDLTHGILPESYAYLLFFLMVVTLIKVALDMFFVTDMGLTLGAMGGNEQMVVVQGVNPEVLKLIGVGLSNGLVAVSGAFAAQYQGFADVNLGQGIVITGLASVMIGEFFVRSTRIGWLTFRVIVGAVVFKAIMYLGRYYGYHIHMTPNDLKLIAGILIIASLAVANYKARKAA